MDLVKIRKMKIHHTDRDPKDIAIAERFKAFIYTPGPGRAPEGNTSCYAIELQGTPDVVLGVIEKDELGWCGQPGPRWIIRSIAQINTLHGPGHVNERAGCFVSYCDTLSDAKGEVRDHIWYMIEEKMGKPQ